MCGIAGFAGFPTPSPGEARAQLIEMCRRITHRGPDGEGYYVSDGVALGMRRLSIIDVAGGQQPIGNEDGNVQVVFNGEIYNYRILRRELERCGHSFRTHSDTETIVHGYEEWGERVLSRLRGMFAIALWDGRSQQLLLARDRLGIKPLYVWERAGTLIFGSELKSLCSHPTFRQSIDRPALLRYLALGYVPDPYCVWEGARKLKPGHLCRWAPGKPGEDVQWWTPVAAEQSGISEADAVAETRRLLEESVACHLESEVPLGAFLSGGIDSSAVVAQMTRLMDRRVRTFSIGFDEAGFDEGPDAKRVAVAVGTEHTAEVLRPDIDALIDELVIGFDEPFADSSALPTWLVSKLARQEVTVALSGDGGDELFGGYTRYAEIQRMSLESPLLRRAARGLAMQLPHGAPGRRYLLHLSRSSEGRYAGTVAHPLLLEEGGVVRRELATPALALEVQLGEWFSAAGNRDLETRMSLVDVLSYLPGDILTKVDRMSMKVSLEARVPLLDHELAEFAFSLPSRLKFRNGQGKWVLRQAVKGLVPDSVLTKPKQGFGVPLARWLRGPLKHRLERLRDATNPIFEFCDQGATRRLLREHLIGRRDHSYYLWRLLVLSLWLEARGA